MSLRAGSILTVGGNNVIDRIQSVGLNDPNVPIEVIREVGNMKIVDKVPGEPDFTFSLESLDVSTDLIALLTGKIGSNDDNGVQVADATGDTTNNSPVVNNIVAGTGTIRDGQLVSGPGIPHDTLVKSIVGNVLTLTKDATATAVGAALTFNDIDTETQSDDAPGSTDASGTRYQWSACECLNITSPWKEQAGDPPLGHVDAGHLVPGYYPTRLSYRFGVTDNAQVTAELAGGSFFYANGAPVEEFGQGDGVQTAFITSQAAIAYRKGGSGGTTFRHVFGVIVGGQLMVEGYDYVVSGGAGASPWAPVTVTFTKAPGDGKLIRFAYFTDATHDYPQAVHASTVVKPGAIRGRNIEVYLGTGGSRQRMYGVQTYEQESTVENEVERELGTEDPIGRTINGFDTTGTVTFRVRDADQFLATLSKVTGVSQSEVFGWLNLNTIPLEVEIKNPKNPAQTLTTIEVPDAIFQTPGTPARVNTAVDFPMRFQSQKGDFYQYKGSKP